MKKHRNTWMMIGLAVLILSTTACVLTNRLGSLFGDDANRVEEKVSATLTAVASEVAVNAANTQTAATQVAETKTPIKTEPTMGKLMGKLAYPSEFLPPQRVVAFDVTDPENYFLTEITSGSTYEIDVPPGTYVVMAYLIDPAETGVMPGFAAGYSEAVSCGLSVDCEDHNLVPVEVNPGETLTDINPIDWYAPDAQRVDWPNDPTQTGTGSILGRLGFPSEYIPPLRVVAFDVFSQDYFYIVTELNQTDYQMDDLPPGTYHVIAFVIGAEPDFGGGYSHFVTCGQKVECTDHGLIDVYVYPGQVTDGVDPVDFYAQPGEVDWPEDPTQ